MKTIHFIGTTNSSFGRGKDKKKRRSRVGLIGGATLGGLQSLAIGRTLSSGIGGALLGAGTGYIIDKSIDKEQERYRREGSRTHLGKIIHDTKVGAKSSGTVGAILGGSIGGLAGALVPARPTGRLARAAILGGAGAVVTGGAAALEGAGTGAGFGIVRGFLQPNKKAKDRVIKK